MMRRLDPQVRSAAEAAAEQWHRVGQVLVAADAGSSGLRGSMDNSVE
jgi:hypothetical protein